MTLMQRRNDQTKMGKRRQVKTINPRKGKEDMLLNFRKEVPRKIKGLCLSKCSRMTPLLLVRTKPHSTYWWGGVLVPKGRYLYINENLSIYYLIIIMKNAII